NLPRARVARGLCVAHIHGLHRPYHSSIRVCLRPISARRVDLPSPQCQGRQGKSWPSTLRCYHPSFSPPKLTVAQAYRGSKQSANAFRVKNLPYSWLRVTCLMQPGKYPLRLGARKLRGEILHRQFLEPCDASEFAQQFTSCPLADAGNFGERSA